MSPRGSRRSATPGELGYTSLPQLTSLLGQYGVRYRRSIGSPPDIDEALRRGNPVLALGTVGRIAPGPDYEGRTSSPGQRRGRYYRFSGGHYFVIKGVTEDGAYYRVHDPNVYLPLGYATYWYADGMPKGRDRLYPREQVWAAMQASGGNQAVELLAPGSATSD